MQNDDDDEEQYWYKLGVRGDGIEGSRFLDAAKDQEMNAPQQRRCGGDRGGGSAIAKDRKELPHRRLDEDKAGDIGKTAAHPVSRRRREPGIFPKPRFGVGIGAGIQFGFAPRERLKDEGQEQHSDTCDSPGN